MVSTIGVLIIGVTMLLLTIILLGLSTHSSFACSFNYSYAMAFLFKQSTEEVCKSAVYSLAMITP